MIALTMILKSFLVDPMMLRVSAISNSNKLPTITGDDFRIAPAIISQCEYMYNAGRPTSQ